MVLAILLLAFAPAFAALPAHAAQPAGMPIRPMHHEGPALDRECPQMETGSRSHTPSDALHCLASCLGTMAATQPEAPRLAERQRHAPPPALRLASTRLTALSSNLDPPPPRPFVIRT